MNAEIEGPTLPPLKILDRTDGQKGVSLCDAYRRLFRLGIPTILSFGSTTLSNTLAFAFVGGHADETQQAAHGLGYSIGNILVLMVGLGLIGGMDTLCPVAIGSRRPQDCWLYLFQASAVVVMAMIPLLPPIFFAERLLILSNQDPLVSYHTARYLQAALPGLLAVCLYEACRKFLIYHRCTYLQTCISLLSIPIQSISLWLFVIYHPLGSLGASIARSTTWILMIIILASTILIRREDFGWTAYVSPVEIEMTQSTVPSSYCRVTDTVSGDSSGSVRPCFLGTLPCLEGRSNSQSGDPVSTGRLIATDRVNDDAQSKQGFGHDPVSDLVTDQRIETEHTSSDDNGESPSSGSIAVKGTTTVMLLGEDNENQSGTEVIRPMAWYQGIPKFLAIAIPATLLCIFEWFSFEIQIFEAAYLGSQELSALAASASLGTLVYIFSLSIAVTLTGEVGRCMGAFRPFDGGMFTMAGLLASLSISVPIGLAVLLARNPISYFYSNSVAVRQLLRLNLIPLAVVFVFDSLHVILGGAIKALGLQGIASILDGIGLLVIMQVCGMILAYKTPLGGRGFIVGTMTGLSIVVSGYLILLFCITNWSKRAKYLAELHSANTVVLKS